MADPCAPIMKNIEELEAERRSLQEELQEASPQEKPFIVSQIKAVNAMIKTQQNALNRCHADHPVPDQPINSRITLTGVSCHRPTDGLFSENDEVYLIAFTANLASLPFFTSTVYRSGVINGMSTGESRPLALRVWGTQQIGKIAAPAPLNPTRPDDMIILLALLEHDSSTVNDIVTAVRGLSAQLANDVNNGSDHATIVNHLVDSMEGFIDLASMEGAPDPDELIEIRRLQLAPSMRRELAFNGSTRSFIFFQGHGGLYKVTFEVKEV